VRPIECMFKYFCSEFSSDTGEVDEIHDARLLAFAVAGLDELVERDGDDRVRAATGRVHVGRRHCSACSTCSTSPVRIH